MQALDTVLFGDRTSHERNDCTARLAECPYPANRTGKNPLWQDAGGAVHGDGVHWPEKHPNEGHRDRVSH